MLNDTVFVVLDVLMKFGILYQESEYKLKMNAFYLLVFKKREIKHFNNIGIFKV